MYGFYADSRIVDRTKSGSVDHVLGVRPSSSANYVSSSRLASETPSEAKNSCAMLENSRSGGL